MVDIKSYPAKNGDAFLLKATDANFLIMIDGGYVETYNNYIKTDLCSLSKSGFILDVLVATHIDADHISGLISLLKENVSHNDSKIISIGEILHNSLFSLSSNAKIDEKLSSDDQDILLEIQNRGYPETVSEKLENEISARQGSSFAKLIKSGGYSWNTGNGNVCIGENGIEHIPLSKASIKILGPNTRRQNALKKMWVSDLRRLGFTGSTSGLDEIFELLCAHESLAGSEELISSSDQLESVYSPDKSITNGSSISFIIEVEGKRILFLGDSWSEDIVEELIKEDLTVFDAIKLSHHGSIHNTSCELLKLIDSPNFFISTNGDRHSHPDYAVLKAIVDRPARFERTLHFNYSTNASRKLNDYSNAEGMNFIVKENEAEWVTIEMTR